MKSLFLFIVAATFLGQAKAGNDPLVFKDKKVKKISEGFVCKFYDGIPSDGKPGDFKTNSRTPFDQVFLSFTPKPEEENFRSVDIRSASWTFTRVGKSLFISGKRKNGDTLYNGGPSLEDGGIVVSDEQLKYQVECKVAREEPALLYRDLPKINLPKIDTEALMKELENLDKYKTYKSQLYRNSGAEFFFQNDAATDKMGFRQALQGRLEDFKSYLRSLGNKFNGVETSK